MSHIHFTERMHQQGKVFSMTSGHFPTGPSVLLMGIFSQLDQPGGIIRCDSCFTDPVSVYETDLYRFSGSELNSIP